MNNKKNKLNKVNQSESPLLKDDGYSLILECELGCEELGVLKEKITSISAILANSGDCLTTFNPETNQLICSETIFGKLNDLSSNKVGENNEVAGTETLFQLNYLIKDSLTSTFN